MPYGRAQDRYSFAAGVDDGKSAESFADRRLPVRAFHQRVIEKRQWQDNEEPDEVKGQDCGDDYDDGDEGVDEMRDEADPEPAESPVSDLIRWFCGCGCSRPIELSWVHSRAATWREEFGTGRRRSGTEKN